MEAEESNETFEGSTPHCFAGVKGVPAEEEAEAARLQTGSFTVQPVAVEIPLQHGVVVLKVGLRFQTTF